MFLKLDKKKSAVVYVHIIYLTPPDRKYIHFLIWTGVLNIKQTESFSEGMHWSCGRTFPPWYPISTASPGLWSLSYRYKISNQSPGQCGRSSTTALQSVCTQNSPSTPGRSCKWAFQSIWQLGPGPKVTQAVVQGTSSAAAPPSLLLYYTP